MPTTINRGSTVRTGLVIIAVAGLAVLAIFQKPAIITALRPGEVIEVALPRNYKVQPYASTVKIAGSQVGVVSSVDDEEDGSVVLVLKVDPGTRDLLGTEPTAEIRPTTVLGGKYYVSLVPGGARGPFDEERIPMERAETPVELDAVLAAVQPEAVIGLQGTTRQLDRALQAGAGESLADLARSAPAALEPAGAVLDALRGTRPDTDLLRLVTDLNSTAEVLTRTPERLRSVVDDLAATSRVLGDNAAPVAETLAGLPEVLRETRRGSLQLQGTLDTITEVAADARPAVRELDPLLEELDPALAELRPVLADLRPLLEDARPLVEQLLPTVEQTTTALRDLRGPVLDRVNGPITEQLVSEWNGTGPKYPNGGGTGNRTYEELGFMFANINNSVQYFNATAHMLGFQPGAGTASVSGTGNAARDLQNDLSRLYGPPHQDDPVALPPADGIPLPDLIGGNGG